MNDLIKTLIDRIEVLENKKPPKGFPCAACQCINYPDSAPEYAHGTFRFTCNHCGQITTATFSDNALPPKDQVRITNPRTMQEMFDKAEKGPPRPYITGGVVPPYYEGDGPPVKVKSYYVVMDSKERFALQGDGVIHWNYNLMNASMWVTKSAAELALDEWGEANSHDCFPVYVGIIPEVNLSDDLKNELRQILKDGEG